MSSFRERYKAAAGTPERGGSEAADFDELPLLSEALSGVRSADGKFWELPPASLTLYLEGSHVKFVIGAQFDQVKTFGTSEGLSSGLAGIERALREGHCETKRVKKS